MSEKVTCSVRNCENKNQKGPKLFQPPCGKERFMWLEALGLSPHTPSNQIRVCSVHFCSDDFTIALKSTKKLLRLKPEAVPHLQMPKGTLCRVKNKKRVPVSGVIVPTQSVSSLTGEKNENSVYLVEQCSELKPITDNAVGVPTIPNFPALRNLSGTAFTERNVKVAIPGSMSTVPVCRICYNPLLNKKTDPYEYLERTDVKTVKTMLGLLLPTSKWDMYRNPVICEFCLELVKKSYSLIQTYIATTESLNNLFENTKNSIPENVDLIIMRKPGETKTNSTKPGPVVLQPPHTSNLVQIKTIPCVKKSDLNNKGKQCVGIVKRKIQPQRQVKIIKDQETVKGEKTICCCVCYETFPDSRTLMAHLNSKECTGPRQKSDLVITGL